MSDVIIVATLTEANLKVVDDVRYGEADLKAEKIFRNRTSARSPFRLRWKDRVRLICPRQDLERLLGSRAIWLLQQGPDGTVNASVYGQIFPLESDHDLEFAIREFERVVASEDAAWPAESVLAFLRMERDRTQDAAE